MLGLVGGYFGVEARQVGARHPRSRRATASPSRSPPPSPSAGSACFVGGCCYGTPTDLPWGVDFGDGLRRHPTQLYEVAFHATLRGRPGLAAADAACSAGQLIKLYIIAYLVYRFVTEFIRPEPVIFAGFTGYQWAAVAFVPVFVLLWRTRMAKADEATCEHDA